MYDLINIDKKLIRLHIALNHIDIKTLLDIAIEAQQKSKAFIQTSTEINLNEDKIRSQYCLSFKAFTKRSMDSPKYTCLCKIFLQKRYCNGKNF